MKRELEKEIEETKLKLRELKKKLKLEKMDLIKCFNLPEDTKIECLDFFDIPDPGCFRHGLTPFFIPITLTFKTFKIWIECHEKYEKIYIKYEILSPNKDESETPYPPKRTEKPLVWSTLEICKHIRSYRRDLVDDYYNILLDYDLDLVHLNGYCDPKKDSKHVQLGQALIQLYKAVNWIKMLFGYLYGGSYNTTHISKIYNSDNIFMGFPKIN